MATNRRNALKRGIALLGTAAGIGAAKTTFAAEGEAPPRAQAATQLVLHGQHWRVTSRDLNRGELPPAGVRMLTRGEVVDRTSRGRKVGDFFATYYRLSQPGKVTPDAPGSLELHTFVFPDGTIVGSGVATAASESEGQFAIVGGTGRYLGVKGAYRATQRHIELGGDGTATFTFTFV